MPKKESIKKGASLGMTVQIDPYEPIKIAAWAEGETDGNRDKLTDVIFEEIFKDLERKLGESIGRLKELKKKALEDLEED